MDSPRTAGEYSPEWVANTRSACLYVATILGDLLTEDMIVIGGLVPGLLIPEDTLPEGVPSHPGTMDLDFGLKLAVLDGAKYAEIAKRLREGGFEVDKNKSGNPTFQTWKIGADQGKPVTVDFLISPSSEEDKPSGIKHLEADFGAIITPGLELAFVDRELISLRDRTTMGEQATRDIPVCGPGAFVVLKALAFQNRGKPKDAYDLYYVIRNFGSGVAEVAARLGSLLPAPEVETALGVLRADFTAPDLTGPRRVAQFVDDESDDVLRQDVVGFVEELLRQVAQAD